MSEDPAREALASHPLGTRLVLDLVPELLSRSREFELLRPKVEIATLYRDPESGGSAAILRYAPGGSVPLHRHAGYEHILVLSGEQEDDHCRYPAGSLIIHPPGSEHRVWSREGCLILAIWQHPVVFLETMDSVR